ncbi:MAG: hypothetical protein FRX49_08967, partial [Trebouxia sp. A1-2]
QGMHVAYVLAFDVIDVANGDPYHGSSTSGGNSCVCASVQVKYDSKATEVDLLQPAFTRRREVFVGRLAMVGFVSAVFGELLTGQGVLGQVGLYTGLSRPVVQALVFGIVTFNYLAAVNPRSPTWSFENQKDVRKRPPGPVQNPQKDAVSDPQGFLGISKAFGFTKRNEVFVGRIAMIGFAAAIVGEVQTGGKGPLGQLALPIHTPIGSQLAGGPARHDSTL